MTKVNYFQVTGTKAGKEEKSVRYARSKKEAADLAHMTGIECPDIKTGVSEMKLADVRAILKTETDMFNLRQKDKALWKANTKGNQVKAQATSSQPVSTPAKK
jgi:hypothetical protein